MVHVSFSRTINNREIILVFIDKEWSEFRKCKKKNMYSITNTFQTIIINVHKMVHVSFSRTINNREIILVFIDLKDFWSEFRKCKKRICIQLQIFFDNNQCIQNGPRILFSCNQ